MARQEVRFGLPRLGLTGDDGDPSGPPQTASLEGPVTAQPPIDGVVDTFGAKVLVIDAFGHAGGLGTLQPLAWNSAALAWVKVGDPFTLSANGSRRFIVDNWAARYSYVEVNGVTDGTVDLFVGGIIVEGIR